jgi:hypothetical protein
MRGQGRARLDPIWNKRFRAKLRPGREIAARRQARPPWKSDRSLLTVFGTGMLRRAGSGRAGFDRTAARLGGSPRQGS